MSKEVVENSRDDADDEFDTELTQAEYANYARMFMTFDKEHKGYLTKDQVLGILKVLGLRLPPEEFQKFAFVCCGETTDAFQMESFLQLMAVSTKYAADSIEPESILASASTRKRQKFTNYHVKPQDTLTSIAADFSTTVEGIRKSNLTFASRLPEDPDEPLPSSLTSLTIPLPGASRFVLRPDAWYRHVITFLVLGAMVYYVIVCLLRDVRPHYIDEPNVPLSQQPVFPWECFLAVVQVVDFGLNFFTVTVTTDGVEINEIFDIAVNYVKSVWFLFELLASFPIDLCVGIDSPGGLTVRHLRLLRIPTLYFKRLIPPSNVLSPTTVLIQYQLIPVLMILFGLFVITHFYCTLWMYLKPEANYIEAVYIVLYTVTTTGYGDIEVNTTPQRIFCCVMFVTGAVVNGFVITKMSQILLRSSIQQEKEESMTNMVSLLQSLDIPPELKGEILSFRHHQLDNDASSAFAETIDTLPSQIQDQMALYARLPHVRNLPLCKGVGNECLIAVARQLTRSLFRPKEFIFCATENGSNVYFLTHGVADVFSKEGKYISTFSRGDYFGTGALFNEKNTRSATIQAVTYCDTFVLSRNAFLEILAMYPVFRKNFERISQKTTSVRDIHQALSQSRRRSLSESVMGALPGGNPQEQDRRKTMKSIIAKLKRGSSKTLNSESATAVEEIGNNNNNNSINNNPNSLSCSEMQMFPEHIDQSKPSPNDGVEQQQQQTPNPPHVIPPYNALSIGSITPPSGGGDDSSGSGGGKTPGGDGTLVQIIQNREEGQ
eukprot:PhF_6_TR43102/c1_g1_i3/m.65854